MKLVHRVKRLERDERSAVVCIVLRPGETVEQYEKRTGTRFQPVEQYEKRTGTRFQPGEIVIPLDEQGVKI